MKTNALLRVTALLQPHYCLRAVRLTLRKVFATQGFTFICPK